MGRYGAHVTVEIREGRSENKSIAGLMYATAPSIHPILRILIDAVRVCAHALEDHERHGTMR